MIVGRVILTSKPKSVVRHTDYTVYLPHAGVVQAKNIKEVWSNVPDEANLVNVVDDKEGLTIMLHHEEVEML